MVVKRKIIKIYILQQNTIHFWCKNNIINIIRKKDLKRS